MRRALLALALALASLGAWAQVSVFDLGLGVRAMGLGGAYAAVAEGAEGLLYNPAGLARVRGLAVDSTILASWVGAGYVGAALPSVGVGLAYLGTSAGENLGFSQLGLILGFGMDLRFFGLPGWEGGLALRYQSTNIAGEGQTGFGLDVGVAGAFPLPVGDVRATLVIRELAFGGLSTEFVLAGAWLSPIGLFAAVDLTSEYTALGLGWTLGFAEIRLGLRQEGVFRVALGLGVRFGNYTVDYALLTHPLLSPSHRFGFGVRF